MEQSKRQALVLVAATNDQQHWKDIFSILWHQVQSNMYPDEVNISFIAPAQVLNYQSQSLSFSTLPAPRLFVSLNRRFGLFQGAANSASEGKIDWDQQRNESALENLTTEIHRGYTVDFQRQQETHCWQATLLDWFLRSGNVVALSPALLMEIKLMISASSLVTLKSNLETI